MSRKNKKRKSGHGGAFFFGLLIFGFAVFGVYTAVSYGIDKVESVKNSDAKKAEYEKFLEPFVVTDPTPFDDVSTADSADLLDAAVSSLIYNSDKMNTYDVYDGEVAGLLVPQSDVEAEFVKLFGNEVKLVHTDVADSFYGVTYSASNKAYIIPIAGFDPTYTPKVYSIEKTGSSIVLNVGYIIGSEWSQLKHGEYTAPEPAKYMKITLREDGNSYHIGSLGAADTVEIADNAAKKAETQTQTTTAKAEVTTKPSDEAETASQDESSSESAPFMFTFASETNENDHEE